MNVANEPAINGNDSTRRNQAAKAFDALHRNECHEFQSSRNITNNTQKKTDTTYNVYCSSTFVRGKGHTEAEILYSGSLVYSLSRASSAVL